MSSQRLERCLHAAPPLVLVPSRLKWLAMFAGSAAFVAGGGWMLQDPKASAWIGWASILFFGACGLASLPILLFPKRYALVLESRHFTINHAGRKTVYEWKNVSQFVALRMDDEGGMIDKAIATGSHFTGGPVFRGKAPDQVFFDDLTNKGKSAEFIRNHVGASGMLPDTYGFKPEELAALMNYWRVKGS